MLGNNSGWQINKDNQVTTSAAEMKKLKPRVLTDRILFIECPQYPVMDAQIARLIAMMHISDALIGGCGNMTVRGKVWHYEFKTVELNNSIKRRWPGREGILQTPIEKQAAGNVYDETHGKIWTVPASYGARESVKFPAS